MLFKSDNTKQNANFQGKNPFLATNNISDKQTMKEMKTLIFWPIELIPTRWSVGLVRFC